MSAKSGDTIADPDWWKPLESQSMGSPTSAEQSSIQNAMASAEDAHEFLRIIPDNNKAKQAFHGLVEKQLRQELDVHHAQYLVTRGRSPLRKGTSPSAARHSDETTDDEPAESPIAEHLYHGYFRVSFDCPSLSGRVKWVMGRGSGKKFGPDRNVDILLAPPSSTYSSGLNAAHAFLSSHMASGVWLLRAGQSFVVEGKDIPSDGTYCLNRPRNFFKVNGMHFWIQFTVNTPEKEQSYLKRRNEALNAAHVKIPCTSISGIPFESDIKLTAAVFRHGLGSGTFATVFEGFEPQSGDLRVIKKISMKSEAQAPPVAKEIDALQTFSGSPGVVKLYDWRTSLGGQSLSTTPYPLEVYIVQEKGVAFIQHPWKDEQPSDWDLRTSLCCQLLEGVRTIHDFGWMHRDITPMNILYFSDEPTHAALCDFGKACQCVTHTETALAGWIWLPPEVQRGQLNVYDQKLDIWMLALALTYCWFPWALDNLYPRNKQQHSTILERLGTKYRSPLSSLVAKMLSWEPRMRPSAVEALTDPCFRYAQAAEPAESSSRKRQQVDSER